MIIPYVNHKTRLVRAYWCGVGKSAVICPAAFMMALAIGQLQLGLVLYAKLQLEAGRSQIGLLAGIWAVAYIIGCLFLNPRLGRLRPRHLVMLSSLSMAGFAMGMPLTESLWILMALYALFGLTLSLFWPPMMGWLSAKTEGVRLNRLIGRFNFAWCSGFVVSPFICGWLSERDPRHPLILAAALPFLIFVFVLGASSTLPLVRNEFEASASAEAVADTGGGGGCPLRFAAWLGLFASFVGLGVVVAVFPLAALDEWGLRETTIGGLFTLRGLTTVVGFLLLGRWPWWHFKRLPMLTAQWLTAVVFLGFATFNSTFALAMLLALMGIFGSMSYNASIFHGAANSVQRARRMAIHESVLAAGLLCGSVAGGWLYERISTSAVFVVFAAIIAVLTIAQTALANSRRVRATA